MVAALLGAAASPAAVAVSSGAIYAGALNTPGGSVWMGSHLWATDHVNGLCRPAPAPDGAQQADPGQHPCASIRLLGWRLASPVERRRVASPVWGRSPDCPSRGSISAPPA